MNASVGAQLECATLDGWTDQMPLLDVARLYDVLRESLSEANREYRQARIRHDGAAAARTLQEVADLTALLDVTVDEFAWRRPQYLNNGRLWPLGTVA